ncbi:MAG: nucleotidyl transferase AbiEii/AbiGii toxin family protein [Bacteroidales bacterium]|nr:nucleotidyl transferase AbiEii/AbiGii toxin family protein [Candidatus Cryptobacteroides aphodequi]
METKSYTKKELRKLMEATGYPMASIEKTMRLLDLLVAINEDAFLAENLTLKGGTAINIIHYEEIPRLSVDLDFDLARNTTKEEMLAIKDEVSSRIGKLGASMGYFCSDPRPNYAIHQTELFYTSATGNRDKIKLDINCLSRCHLYDTVVREARNPFSPEGTFSVRMLSEYELFGAKLKALLERNTPRDIYDAYILEQKGLYRDDESVLLIRKCLAYYISLSRGIDITQSLDAIRKRPIQDFKKQLFPMLKTGYGFVDRELMTSEAINCVSRFLGFTDKELAYLEAARAGVYRPELLFDGDFALRISENPAATFYITNGA